MGAGCPIDRSEWPGMLDRTERADDVEKDGMRLGRYANDVRLTYVRSSGKFAIFAVGTTSRVIVDELRDGTFLATLLDETPGRGSGSSPSRSPEAEAAMAKQPLQQRPQGGGKPTAEEALCPFLGEPQERGGGR
jgi:hypothetical protein